MVSRVYTPLIAPYGRATQAGRGALNGPADEDPPPFQSPARQPDVQPEPGQPPIPTPSAAGGLQAVQFDRLQKIPLNAVLHDFNSTMDALGADDRTRAEVAAYLKAVGFQAAKDQPEIPFIKHALRTAAGSLDQFISRALGQPSSVVKEWVDALLLQDIEFHTEDLALIADELPNASNPRNPAPEAASVQAESNHRLQDKARVKALIEQAKAEQQTGRAEQAQAHLQAALDVLRDQNQPAWEGKVWHLRGRFYDKSGDWRQAVAAFEQAAAKLSAAGLPEKQAHALHAMAATLEDHGQLAQAREAYGQVVALDELQVANGGKPDSLIQSLNHWGGVSLRMGDASAAIAPLERAARESARTAQPPDIHSDILSNLGAAYRARKDYDAAIGTYRQSLRAARSAKDKARYGQTLQQLAALYVEAGRPEHAMKALQRLKTL